MSSEHDRTDDAPEREPRRIRGDLKVSGVLRIGSDTIIEGSVIAPGGVVFGDRVTVQGDVVTHGAIEMGHECHIEGRINPPAPVPATSIEPPKRLPPPDLAERMGAGIRREAEDELRFATLETSLSILFSLAQEGLDADAPLETGVDWGLPEDALEDMLDGLHDFMGELFRAQEPDAPWTRDEVVDILLKKGVGLLAPISVEREADDRAVVSIGRPSALSDPERSSEGWVRPLLATIHLLGSSVDEDFRIEPLDAAEFTAPTANPARIKAIVRL